MHPSMDDDFEDDLKAHLPEGVTEEQVTALTEKVIAEIDKLGLYPRHAHVVVGEDETLAIHAIFTFGKVAFTPRVQNPVQDQFDDTFRQIETDELDNTIKDIIEGFKRGKPEA